MNPLAVLIKDSNSEKSILAEQESANNNSDNQAKTTNLTTLLSLIIIYGALVYVSLIVLNSWFILDQIDQTSHSLGLSWMRQKEFNGKLYLEEKYKPQQLHLSLGLNSSELYVTWSTLKPVASAQIEYSIVKVDNDGEESFGRLKLATGKLFEKRVYESDPKWIRATRKSSRVLYTYRAKLKNLKVNHLYIYRAISHNMGLIFTSETYRYIVQNLTDPFRPIKLALFGDLGVDNGQSIPRLIDRVDSNDFDLIIHNGDFAYDLDRHNGEQGDIFMRMMEPIAARVPYQTSVGNHEVREKFAHYDHRFTMINSGSSIEDISHGKMNNFYYSFNAGPIHFVSFSTEFYYFLDYMGINYLKEQYNWLKRDLDFATSDGQRKLRPWIIVFGHRPMYCSSTDNDDCTRDSDILRRGIYPNGSYALEELFYNYGVDVLFWSHEHLYERFLPIYNNQVISSKTDPHQPYANPRAPVHVISGSAGCEERIDSFRANVSIGSVSRIADYGYTQLMASYCELKFEQISDDQQGKKVDQFVITKSKQNFPSESKWQYNCDDKTKETHYPRESCPSDDWWCY